MVDKIFEESWMVLLIYIIYLSFSWMVAMYFYAVMDLYLCINLHLPAHFWRVFFFFLAYCVRILIDKLKSDDYQGD